VSLDPNFSQYWLFHVVNYVLALEIYTMFGRVVLGFLARNNPNNAIMRAFVVITEPVIRAFAFATPRFLLQELVPLYVAFLLFIIRVIFGLVMLNLGMAPSVGGG
jgi:YggT family protein